MYRCFKKTERETVPFPLAKTFSVCLLSWGNGQSGDRERYLLGRQSLWWKQEIDLEMRVQE